MRVILTILLAISLAGCNNYSCCGPNICPPVCSGSAFAPHPSVDWEYYPYVLDYDTFDDCYTCCDDQEECAWLGEACDTCASAPCQCRGGGCSSSCSKGGVSGFDPYTPLVDEYRIALSDVLEISVFGDEDTLIENVIVAPDGRVYYLFLDGIQAVGRTPEELKVEIEKKLAEWFVAPIISVIPQVMTDNTFTVLGMVNAPGLYPISQATSLREAIGAAGGTVQDPENLRVDSGKRVLSTRAGGRCYSYRDSFMVRKGEKLPIDFEGLLTTADPKNDIAVLPGDYIYIAENLGDEVFIMGLVNGHNSLQWKTDMTLMCALAASGGWSMGTPYSADVRNVLIIRGSLTCPKVVRVDLSRILSGEARDFMLKPGDIVYVHQKPFPLVRDLIRLTINTFIGSFVQTAADAVLDKYIFEDKK